MEMDTAMHGDFNALRAQVAINDGDQTRRNVCQWWLEELPLANYYSRIVATSVHGEVLHCKGKLTKSLAVMQQTEQMARRHDVWHYALWSIIQQSEILFARASCRPPESQRKPSSWYANSILSSCRCMSSCCASVLSCCGHGRASTRLKLAPAGMDVLSTYQPQQQLQCPALMVQCSLARGDLDNARSHLNRLENLLGNGHYHSDWVSNADKVRVIYWQMTGDKPRRPTGCARRQSRSSPTTTSCRASGATLPGRRSCWATSNRRKWCWKS